MGRKMIDHEKRRLVELTNKVASKILYHANLDEIAITKDQARNIAAHVVILLQDERERGGGWL